MSGWCYFRSVLVDDNQVAEENRLICGAGVLLRTGARGALFMRILFTVMPSLQHDCRVHVLTLIRQLVVLMPNNPYDDSALLPLSAQESDTPHITVATPVPSRQTFLTEWPGDASLEVPLPLVALVSEFVGDARVDVQRAALLAGCTLLMRGHRGMQDCYRSFCRRSPNEQLFATLRNHFMEFKEKLQTYSLMLANESSPSEAGHYLTQMSNCCLELKLLELLCAGQCAPLAGIPRFAAKQSHLCEDYRGTGGEILSIAPRTANEVTAGFMIQLMSTLAAVLQGPRVMYQDMLVAYRAADHLTSLLSALDAFPHRDTVSTAIEVVPPSVSWHWLCCGRGWGGSYAASSTVEERRHRCRYSLETLAVSTLLGAYRGP